MGRFCPECDTRTEQAVCPRCGTRTLRDRQEIPGEDPLLGRVLDGRYRVEALIGRGGMGAVYRGVQLATGQTVAIKVIRGDSARDVEAAKRFHREARAASLLAHPHTIRVMDFGESEEGDLFMVLEFLAGRTLGREIHARGTLREGRLAKIACEVAQSLAEAHAAGLVHRDLKPENVMLLDVFGDPDFVKVLDFGIAKFLSGSSGESSVTRTGAVVGTPHYMAPEQARGLRGLTGAVDVYALGIILHEGLTGRRPFEGDTPLNVLMAHVREPVPELPPGCGASDTLRGLVRRMLAKDPDQRPSAVEAARALAGLRDGTPLQPEGDGLPPTAAVDVPGLAHTTPVARAPVAPAGGGTLHEAPRRGRRRLVAALSAAVLCAGATLGAWALWSARSPDPSGLGTTGSSEAPPGPGPVPAAAPPPAPAEAPAAAAEAPAALPDRPSPAAAPVPAPPPDRPAATPGGTPPPEGEGFTVQLDSSPPGATVLWGGRRLGVAPVTAFLPGTPGTRTFEFRLQGHRDERIVLDVAPGSVVRATLQPEAAAAAPAPARKARPSKAPRPSGVTDHW